MVPGLPRPPNGNDSRNELRITAAPCVVCGIQTQHWQGETPIHPGCAAKPKPRSLEELMAAPTAPDPEAALAEAHRATLDLAERERRAISRELARRLTMPLPELLREGDA